MLALLYTLHILICIFLILVVLLQQGKGADLSVFGGGGTMTAFGARGAATVLHKLTVFSFVAFIVTTMMIGIFLGGGTGSSVMSDLETAAAEQEATAAADGEEAAEVAEPVGALEAATETPEAAAAAAEEAASTGPTADDATDADAAEEGADGKTTAEIPNDG